ncbi:MAG: alanine glycine permease [Rhodopirellula sp.]|nr:alanine glycine permease [Rhodopirellula sp.]MAI73314.1 alanine glycine permease [Rhodopirellula sp.]OUX50386.1 MAG: alanine glycine permease [Rhodopirellula sp. TMED283]
MPTPRLALLLLALAWLPIGSLAAQTDEPTTSDQPVASEPAGEANSAADASQPSSEQESPTSESSSEAVGTAKEVEASVAARIDEAFGNWIVSPFATVLFFDFYTGPRTKEVTDEFGNTVLDQATGDPLKVITRRGWLRTEANPDGISIPFVVVWLLAGAVFLTLRMGFINVRAFKHAIDLTRGLYDKPGETGEVSHFQALSAALSATVGLGNIAGVAIAIGTGGPGACLWIIAIGLLGMSAKFAECTLGQLYRTKDEGGNVLGGPMRYLQVGLADINMAPLGKFLAILFMLLCVGASFGGGNAFQIGQSLEAIRGDVPILQDFPVIYGVIMAALVGIVIVGGMRSIGAVAGKIVPFMCGAYVLAALFILANNIAGIPAAISLIWSEAFEPNAMYGGFLGVLVIGVKRAVFSNEAGVGSAAIAHSAAKTDEPVSEGIVALLEPFIDTVVVCTITALVVIVTGAYNAPEMTEAIAQNQGAKVTLFAFITGGYDWFRYILYFAVVLFAYSTCISWSYYGERCWVQLFGARLSIVYKILFLGFTVLGSIVTAGPILEFSDLMILGMSFPNLLGVFLLSGIVKRELNKYWTKYKAGELDIAEDGSAGEA